MDAIRQLQARAAEKRDQAIADARRQYRKDIEAIEALARTLPAPLATIEPRPLGRAAAIVDQIEALVPPDQPFTVGNMMDWLAAEYPGATFHQPTVRTYTSRMCGQGYLRRLYKTGHKETVYIKATSDVTDGPIETKSLASVADEILRDAGRPLKVSEIAVAMRERGYRVDNAPNTLMRAIRDNFKRYRGQFVRGKDGRWELVTASVS